MVPTVCAQLKASDVLALFGSEVVDFACEALRIAPEASRALEASVHEALVQEADETTYNRRKAAIEQERAIKENELRTELAVANKKRELRENQMEAERSVKEKERQIHKEDMDAQVALENK